MTQRTNEPERLESRGTLSTTNGVLLCLSSIGAGANRYWLENPDPTVDHQLFEIAVRGQEAVARRFSTGMQHYTMHAMAMSAGLHRNDASRGRVGGPGTTGTGSHARHLKALSSHEFDSSMKEHQRPRNEPEPSRSSSLAEAGAFPRRIGDCGVPVGDSESDGNRDGEDCQWVDGVRAIASASSVLIRLGHPLLLFEVERLVGVWVSVWSLQVFPVL